MDEYLFGNMKKAEAANLTQWQKDFTLKEKAKAKGQALDSVNADLQSKTDPQFLIDWLDRHQYDLGGMYAAREELAATVKTLIEDGKLSVSQVTNLFGTDAYVVGKNGNKIKLGSWKEFQGMEQLAIDTANGRAKQQLNARVIEDKQVDQGFQDLIENDEATRNLSPIDRYKLVQKYKESQGRKGMADTASMTAFLSRPAEYDTLAEKEIQQRLNNGGTVSESDLTTPYLRAKFGDKVKSNEWAKNALEDIQDTVDADIATALKLTTGEEKASNRSYTEGIRYARAKALELLQTTRAQNPEMSDEQVKAKVLKDIKALAGEPGNFLQSPFYYENVSSQIPKNHI